MNRSVILMGASVCGIVGYILYLVFKKDEEDDSDFKPKKSNFKTTEVSIPKDKVRTLIGRNGKNIKAIQVESNTRISFKGDGEEGKLSTCIIRGTSDACAVAHNLIEEFLSNQVVIESVTLEVPQSSVGRIIGRCGEQITDISARSGAKIRFDDNHRCGPSAKAKIMGSKQQIEMAKSLIEGIVQQSLELDVMLAKREPRITPKIESPKTERISPIPGQNDSQFEVYVSAMIDPSHFWVQIVGPKAPQLDQLVEDMSEYYGDPENRAAHILNAVVTGDLVAAEFHFDKKWYRAEVLEVLTNNGTEPHMELYYVDYGDTDIVPCKEVFELRTDFLRLNFQAIECYLSGVEPNGDDWSEEALDKFEEWTHVAQWKKLAAKMNGYCVREKTRAKREGSPVPGIELYDVNNDEDVNIAKELVTHGFAVFKKDSDLRITSSGRTSTSNISVNSN